MTKKDNFLSARQVSNLLGIHLRTVQRLTKKGKLRGIRIGNLWKYRKSDIEKYINFGTDVSLKSANFLPKSEYLYERRAYPRINTNLNCQYSIDITPFKRIDGAGIIKDISAGGIFLTNQGGTGDFGIGDPIDLCFTLVIEDDALNIKAKGKVIRLDNVGVGIRFRHLGEEAKNRIMHFVE